LNRKGNEGRLGRKRKIHETSRMAVATCQSQSKYAQAANSGRRYVTNGYLAVHYVLGAFDLI
jgi:hypothetical protein